MEELKIILPIAAIAISIIALAINIKNVKKQIRVGRIEEILEALNMLSRYYIPLVLYIHEMKDIQEVKASGKAMPEYLTDHSERLKVFLDSIDKVKLESKISRMSILSDSYLSNKNNRKLKIKIHMFAFLISLMFYVVYNNDLHFLETEYPHRLPRRARMGPFIVGITDDLIKEMQLGYKSMPYEDFKEYKAMSFPKMMSD